MNMLPPHVPRRRSAFWPVVVGVGLSALIVLGGLLYCWRLLKRVQSDRATIEEVGRKRQEARLGAWDYNYLGKLTTSNLNFKAFADGLEMIDVAQTPTAFRLAWLDYVEAWRNRGKRGVLELARDASQIAAARADPSGLNDISRRADRRDTDAFWYRCRREAVKCGVDLPVSSNDRYPE